MVENYIPLGLLSNAIEPKDYIVTRYIFMMVEFGFDEEAVLEMLQVEFPNMTLLEIKGGVEPYKELAQQWYEKGRTMIHGLILGWLLAGKRK